jgi:hypothetical protein
VPLATELAASAALLHHRHSNAVTYVTFGHSLTHSDDIADTFVTEYEREFSELQRSMRQPHLSIPV